MAREIIVGVLLGAGALFTLLACIGLWRMPDVYTRMQATTKAVTLGTLFTMIAVTVAFARVDVGTRALLVVAFLFYTAPISAHMLARAAYFMRIRQCPACVVDELEGHYDFDDHELH